MVLILAVQTHQASISLLNAMFLSVCPVSGAIDLLQDLDILNEKEELTSLGKKISCFGSDPRIAKAIIFSTIFRCVCVSQSVSLVLVLFHYGFTAVCKNILEKGSYYLTFSNRWYIIFFLSILSLFINCYN